VSAIVSSSPATRVVTLADLDEREAEALVARYGARLVRVPDGTSIPGSYWGDSEAGLVSGSVYVRADTPVHSLLHELGHYVCMDAARRRTLATDAGGCDDEECGVCYLQVFLAEQLTGFGAARCLRDMDAWGYSFREGSARAWLDGDSVHARAWLIERGLIDARDRPTWRVG
jgi:hypothetical protein